MPKLAKRRVDPDHWTGPAYIETYGPEVAEVNASAGFAPDPQQELCLDLIFAIGGNGLCACFEFGCIVCRQNLKTGLLKQVGIGWLTVTEVPWFVWSAHELSTTRESMNELHTLFADSKLSRMLPATRNRGLYENNNDLKIELRTGQRIMFKARTMSGGRGLSAPKVILDEAFALKPSHVGSLLPTLLAQPDPQVLYASSAGKADSSVLRDLRDRGRAGSSPRLTYVEWLAPREPCELEDCTHPKTGAVGCALDREDLMLKANPTAVNTNRITLQTIRDLRQALPPEEFMRECFGWWDEEDEDEEDEHEDVFPGWSDCGDVDMDPPAAPAAIGIAVSFDRAWGSIGSAGVLADGRTYVGPTARARKGPWLVDEAARIQQETGCLVVVDGKGPAADLIEDLEEAGVRVTILGLEDALDACAGVYDAVQDLQLVHGAMEELDDAHDAAGRRYVVDRWLLGRRASTDDISMLEAVVWAHWGVTAEPEAELSLWTWSDLEACDGCGEQIDRTETPEGYICARCEAEGKS